MNKTTSALKKAGLLLAIMSFFLVQISFANQTPEILRSSVTKGTIDPTKGETAIVNFVMNASAYCTVTILSPPDSLPVRKIADEVMMNPEETASFAWDGKNSAGAIVAKGTYTVKIEAKFASGEDIEYQRIVVGYEGTPPALETAPKISNLDVSPKTFNPQLPQSVSIAFNLDKAATYSVDVLKDGVIVKNLANAQSATKANSYAVSWNGVTKANSYASEGSYLIRIKASNPSGSAENLYGIVYIDYPATTVPPTQTQTSPKISNAYTYPDPFTPSVQNVKIYYTLDKQAKVTITVLDSSDKRLLKNEEAQNAGTYYVEWDGKTSGGGIVANGSHSYKIIAQNDYGYDVKTGVITVGTQPTPDTGVPYLTNVNINPYMFDPVVGSTQICYTLSANAIISVAVMDGDIQMKKVAENVSRTKGTHCETWDGKGAGGSYANAGTYTVKIYATNGLGYDIELSTVKVNLNEQYTPTSAPDILDVYINPDPFSPKADKEAVIYYQINKKAQITLNIEDLSGVVVKTLVNGIEKSQGTNWVQWFGEDKFGNSIPEGEYKIRVQAWNIYGMDMYLKKIYIGPSGIAIIKTNKCAGFLDVPANSSYCDAIMQMKEMGIFSGYADGTFRPNQPINRAEVVKVILLSLGKTILSDDGTSVGFADIVPFSWFNQYLRTARVHNIIGGYPDGTFRPANTINRAELLKMFLEATKIPIPGCYIQPYPDIPENVWYLKYACFAKQYNLVNADGVGRFNAGMPMKRGDVADLFYRFQSQGLFNVFPYTNY